MALCRFLLFQAAGCCVLSLPGRVALGEGAAEGYRTESGMGLTPLAKAQGQL